MTAHQRAKLGIEAAGGQVLETESGEVWVWGLSASGRGDLGWTDRDFERVFPHFCNLRRLDRLELSCSSIGDHSLALVGKLQNLRELIMQSPSNQVTDEGLWHLMNLGKLRVLVIDHTWKRRWNCLERVQELRFLEELEVWTSGLDDASFQYLARHPSLRKLKIHGTQVSTKSVAVLVTMPHLESVVFSDALDDTALLELADAPSLKELFIGNTKVTPTALEKFRRLRPDVKIVGEDVWEILRTQD